MAGKHLACSFFSLSLSSLLFTWPNSDTIPLGRPARFQILAISVRHVYLYFHIHRPTLRLLAFMLISLLDWELLEGRAVPFFSRIGPGSLLNGPQHAFSSPFSLPLSTVVFILLWLRIQDHRV